MTMAKVIPFDRAARAARTPSRSTQLSDHQLVELAASGEEAGLSGLFERHVAAVYRFLASMAAIDERDLDDLVQATFVEVFASASRFRGGSTVRTWILGIAYNMMRRHVRRTSRRRRRNAA